MLVEVASLFFLLFSICSAMYYYQIVTLSKIKTDSGFKDYFGIFTSLAMIVRSNTSEKRRAELAKRQLQQAQKFGFRPYLIYFLHVPTIVVNDPENAKRIFLNSKVFEKNTEMMKSVPHAQQFVGDNVVLVNGEMWRQQRSIMNPAFYNIERFSSVFAIKAKDCLDAMLEKSTRDNLKVSVPTFMTSFALDVLGRTVFGIPFNYISDALDGDSTTHKEQTNQDESSTSDLSFLKTYHYVLSNAFTLMKFLGGHLYNKIPTSSNIEYEKELHKFDSLIYYVIKQAKERRDKGFAPDYTPTLLDMMVDSVDDQTGQGMSERELRDNVVVFFVAGHDTTASALSTALYILAKHQHIQNKLFEEVKSVIDTNRAPTHEEVDSMDYLNCFLKENLRMYPPVTTVLGRRLNKDEIIGDLSLKKGQSVNVNIFSIHHNPDVWKNPEEFRPERFSEQEKKGRHSFAWIPFGGGPRTCIGNAFSLLEQKIFLVSLLQRFHITLEDPSYILQTSTVAGLLSSPDKNLKVMLNKRS